MEKGIFRCRRERKEEEKGISIYREGRGRNESERTYERS